mmetsp:Transcript_65897/g.157545  ORF Transcript_65897/g.157545 Transcript_65897/m.157545 type:complete len:571 (-) Transcript_65897:103-1815(-)
MITYESGGKFFLLNVFRVHGSVFPKALVVSLPCALLTAFLEWASNNVQAFKHLKDNEEIMTNSQAWAGFSFLVGFLVVFRTSQAYSRFWEGLTAMHMMRSRWLDAASALLAFCKHSEANIDSIVSFEMLLVRLYSMLHASALADIEDCGDGQAENTQAFEMELIDPCSIDLESLRTVRDSDMKVELIFQWLQQLIVENIKTGVLSIPPPILTRTFGEMATGLVYFNEALKISTVPFPFPYAQTCDLMLILQFFLVPIIFMQWVTSPFWAASLTFIQVFPLWALNLIAVELENPFGSDPNDTDCPQMQREFNKCMRMLVANKTTRTPHLVAGSPTEFVARVKAESEGEVQTFETVWHQMLDAEERNSDMPKKTNLTERRFTHLKRRTQASGGLSTMNYFPSRIFSDGVESYGTSSRHRPSERTRPSARSPVNWSMDDEMGASSRPPQASSEIDYVVKRSQHTAAVRRETQGTPPTSVALDSPLKGSVPSPSRLSSGHPLCHVDEEELQVKNMSWEVIPQDLPHADGLANLTDAGSPDDERGPATSRQRPTSPELPVGWLGSGRSQGQVSSV